MSRTPAAELARVKCRFPGWEIENTGQGIRASQGESRRIWAPSLATLEIYLAEKSHHHTQEGNAMTTPQSMGTQDSHTVTSDHISTALASTDGGDSVDSAALWASICDLFTGSESAPSYTGAVDPAYASGTMPKRERQSFE